MGSSDGFGDAKLSKDARAVLELALRPYICPGEQSPTIVQIIMRIETFLFDLLHLAYVPNQNITIFSIYSQAKYKEL